VSLADGGECVEGGVVGLGEGVPGAAGVGAPPVSLSVLGPLPRPPGQLEDLDCWHSVVTGGSHLMDRGRFSGRLPCTVVRLLPSHLPCS
jgi:hypothetical protein